LIEKYSDGVRDEVVKILRLLLGLKEFQGLDSFDKGLS